MTSSYKDIVDKEIFLQTHLTAIQLQTCSKRDSSIPLAPSNSWKVEHTQQFKTTLEESIFQMAFHHLDQWIACHSEVRVPLSCYHSLLITSPPVANILVGNDEGVEGFEITFTGPRIKFHSPAVIAICGAETVISLNSQKIDMWTRHPIPADAELNIGEVKGPGCRAYLAILGGLPTV